MKMNKRQRKGRRRIKKQSSYIRLDIKSVCSCKPVCAALKGASQDEAISFSLEQKTKLVNRLKKQQSCLLQNIC